MRQYDYIHSIPSSHCEVTIQMTTLEEIDECNVHIDSFSDVFLYFDWCVNPLSWLVYVLLWHYYIFGIPLFWMMCGSIFFFDWCVCGSTLLAKVYAFLTLRAYLVVHLFLLMFCHSHFCYFILIKIN